MIDNAFYRVTNNNTKQSMYCKTLPGAISQILKIEEDLANKYSMPLDEYVQDFSFWTWKDYCDFVFQEVIDYFTRKPKDELVGLFGGCWTITRFFFTV